MLAKKERDKHRTVCVTLSSFFKIFLLFWVRYLSFFLLILVQSKRQDKDRYYTSFSSYFFGGFSVILDEKSDDSYISFVLIYLVPLVVFYFSLNTHIFSLSAYLLFTKLRHVLTS